MSPPAAVSFAALFAITRALFTLYRALFTLCRALFTLLLFFLFSSLLRVLQQLSLACRLCLSIQLHNVLIWGKSRKGDSSWRRHSNDEKRINVKRALYSVKRALVIAKRAAKACRLCLSIQLHNVLIWGLRSCYLWVLRERERASARVSESEREREREWARGWASEWTREWESERESER